MTPDQLAQEALRTRFSWIDSLIATFLRIHRCDISEVELVEVMEKTEIRWFIRKKEADGDRTRDR